MALRARFVLLLLTLTIFPTWLLSQETPGKDTAPDQAMPENNAKYSKTHCDIPSCVQKVLYFSNISQPTEMQDVVNAVRAIVDIQRVQQFLGAQIIVIEGTAVQVAMAEKLAAEIDKDKRRFGGLGYRIDVRIQESEGDRKIHSRLYSFISDARQTARVGIGRPGPSKAQNEPSSEPKQTPDPANERSIECRILGEFEHTLELGVETGFASDAAGGSPSPFIRSRVHVTVELDKPTIISRIDDPDSDRTITIELTAARIR